MKRVKSEKGQAMVEFALIMPLLSLVLCAIMDFGWVLSQQNELVNLAGDSARYAAINYSSYGDTQLSGLKDGVTSYVEANEVLNKRVVVDSVTLDDTKTYVQVKLSCKTPFITGLAGIFFRKNEIELTAVSAMPIEPYL